jgi:glycine cleavage system aminomethyltransferase T
VGVERQVEITGPDAFAFANMLVARDLAKCEVGQCKYVFVTAPDGGIINDPVLLRLGEDHFWLSLADSDVLLWALGVAHGSGLDVTIREPDIGPVQIQGPKSKDVMVELFGDDVLEVPYYFLRRYELDGMPVLVSRTGYTAELGYEIYVFEASRYGERLWEAVLEAGRPHGLSVIGPCHIRRIEGGILAYGADMWLDTNPYEVGMGYDWMVDLEQKDEFIGKQALARIKQKGPKRKLAGVEIAGASLGAYNDGSMIDVFPVSHRGERVGQVTSACHSPRLGKNIGYAMVPIELADLGTELEVDVEGDRRDAVVVEMPFIDPNKEIPKQRLATEH